MEKENKIEIIIRQDGQDFIYEVNKEGAIAIENLLEELQYKGV